MSCDNIDNKKKIKTCTSTTTKTAKSKIADESEFDYSKLVIPKEILRKMLIRENELRLCEETQKEYFRIESQPQMPGDWLDYTAKLQEQVIEEFGFKDNPTAIWQLRCACTDHPDLTEHALYVKYNRAREGDLRVGDNAPDSRLVSIVDQSSHQLLEFVPKDTRPLLICAASWS